MGSFTAQVQSPQTTGGKGSPAQYQLPPPPPDGTSGNPFRRNVADPGPAGLTIMGANDVMPQGKGSSTNSATSGQPRMGLPNNYANTVGGWDNASIRPQSSAGKGKGG